MTNIITFAKGGEPRALVNEKLVAQLEMMLEQAREGYLTSAAYACAYADGAGRNGWEKVPEATDAISSGLLMLVHRYSKTMSD